MDVLPFLGIDPGKDADALLRIIQELRRDILSYELRSSFLAQLRRRSERLLSELRERPDGDPQNALVSMLLTASLGMNEDEFTTPKLEALRQCLVALGAARMAPLDGKY